MREKTASSRLQVRKQVDSGKVDEAMMKFDRYEAKIDDIEAQVEKDVLITEEFLSQHHVALRRIYKAYAAQGGGGVAIKQEIFLKFCKDCKIPDKKFTEHMLPIVFIRANWDDPNESKDPKNKRVAAALNPSEWVEALVRCANGKYLEEKSLYKKI